MEECTHLPDSSIKRKWRAPWPRQSQSRGRKWLRDLGVDSLFQLSKRFRASDEERSGVGPIDYHHELLQQANELMHKTDPNQADLRRSVSSAYYALFHLLVFETTSHWSLDGSRNAPGGMFDHTPMKRASNRLSDGSFPSPFSHPLLAFASDRARSRIARFFEVRAQDLA